MQRCKCFISEIIFRIQIIHLRKPRKLSPHCSLRNKVDLVPLTCKNVDYMYLLDFLNLLSVHQLAIQPAFFFLFMALSLVSTETGRLAHFYLFQNS